MIWLKLLDIHVIPPSQHKCSTEQFPFYQVEHNGCLDSLGVPRAIPIHI
jgi:hypothetical protein